MICFQNQLFFDTINDFLNSFCYFCNENSCGNFLDHFSQIILKIENFGQ